MSAPMREAGVLLLATLRRLLNVVGTSGDPLPRIG